MKILIIGMISLPLFAAVKSIKIDHVRSIDYDDGEASITLWSTNQVYRLPENASVMPCLENGQKAKKQVVLEVNQDSKIIQSCKLYGGGTPDLNRKQNR